MSEAVDTRVVEAKFDSAQFEKGVDRTVKKLDELKSSLNLKDSGKSVTDLTSKISEGTEKASNSLEKLQDRFTSFTGMLKQKLISGIADEIVGVFFKIKSSFESMVKSMSTAQISVGMQRYTDILTSVRTLVSAGVGQGKAYEAIERLGTYADQTSYSLDSMVSTMSKFKTAGADIDTAARMIEGLSNAAASMGVNAQQAERAYLNLQQAYSKKVMLQNDWISFESLPMVGTQFNQAILDAAVKVGTLEAVKGKEGVYKTKKKAGTKVKSGSGITADNMGSMLQYRWFTDEVMEEVFGNTYYFEDIGIDRVNEIKAKERSIKEEVSKMGLDTAEADKKVNEKLQEYFDETNNIDKENKKKEIERRKETMKLEYENKKATIKADLDVKKITDTEYKKKLDEINKKYKSDTEGLTKELKDLESSKGLTVFAYQAFRAGQEARSFTDVLNTLKDAISRGWAKSFELIFGKLDEAADFFTKLTESNLANAIYRIGEFRNLVLENWVNSGGRNNMIGTLEKIDNLLGSIFKRMGLLEVESAFDQAEYEKLLKEDPTGYAARQYQDWAEREDRKNGANTNQFEKAAQELGHRLAHITANIGLYIERFQYWLEDSEILKDFQELVENIKSIIHGGLYDATGALGKVFEIFSKFEPVLFALFENVNKILEPIKQLFNPEEEGTSGQELYNGIQNILGNIEKIVVLLVGENGDGPLITLLNILGDIAAFFVDMAASTFLANVTFFSDAFGLLLEVLGIGSAQQDNGAGVLDGIRQGLEDLGKTIQDFASPVFGFFDAIIQDVRTWLGLSKDASNTSGGKIFQHVSDWWNTDESIKAIKEKIDKFINDVGKWIQNIPNNLIQYAINIGDIFKSIFYYKNTYKKADQYGNVTEITEWTKTDITIWLEKAAEDIKKWFSELPSKFSNIGISIGDFFKSIFYTKKETNEVDEKGNKKKVVKEVETPLKIWLDKAIETAKNWIKKIPAKIAAIPSLISEFFKGLFYKKIKTQDVDEKGNKTTVEKEVETPLKIWLDKAIETVKKWIEDIPMLLHSAISGIGSFVTLVWNAITGNDQNSADNAAKQAADNTQKALDNSFSNISGAKVVEKIKELASNIWNNILTIFTGNKDKDFNNNWIAEKVAGAIKFIGDHAQEVWDGAKTFLENLPTTIGNIFSSDTENKKKSAVGQAITDFAVKIGTWISEIPNSLLTFVDNANKEIGKIWSKITNTLMGKETGETNITDAFYEKLLQDDPSGYAAHQYKEWKDKQESPIISNISKFFDHLIEDVKLYVAKIPEGIAGGLDLGANVLNNVFGSVTDWLANDNAFNEAKAKFEEKWGKSSEDTYANLLKEDEKNGTEFAKQYLEEKKALFGEGLDSGESTTESAFLTSIKSFGSTVSVLITQTLPNFISQGFTWVKNHAEEWWDALTGLFDGGKEKAEGESKNFGETILNVFRTIFKADTFNQKEYDAILNNLSIGDYAARKLAADQYKAGTTNPIIEFFKGIVRTVGNVFSTLGPTILSGIQKALDWIKTKLTSATEFFNGLVDQKMSVTEMLSKNLEDKDNPGQENPMWTAIKGIGETIWDILTKTIPDFIASAASYIGQQVPKLLAGIFGGGQSGEGIAEEIEKETEKEIVKGLENGTSNVFDQAEYDRLLKEDPTGYAAKQYKEWIEKQNKKEGQLISYEEAMAKDLGVSVEDVIAMMSGSSSSPLGLFGGLLGSTANADALTQEQIDALKKQSEEQYTSVIDCTEFIVGEKEKAVDILQKYDDRLELLKKREDELNRMGTLSAEENAELVYIQQERNRINSIKQAIKDNGLDKQDSIIDDLSMFDDQATVKKVGDAEKNAKGFLGKLGDIFGGFFDGFKNLSGSTIGRWVLIIGAISLFLMAINTLIDNLIFTDDIAKTVKWTGLTILITAISTLIGYMVYLSAQAEEGSAEEKKLQRVKTTLKEFGDFIKDILTSIGWILGLLTAKEFITYLEELNDTSNSKTDAKSLSKGQLIAKNLLTPLNSLISGFTGALGSTVGKGLGISITGGMIGDMVESLSDNINNVFQNLGTGMREISDYIENAVGNLVSIKDDIGGALGVVDDVIELISKMVGITYLKIQIPLDEINSNSGEVAYKTVTATDGVKLVSEMFSKLSGGLSLFKNSISGYSDDAAAVVKALGDLLNLKDQMNEFAIFAQDSNFDIFKDALATLGSIMRLYADAVADITVEPSEADISNAVGLVRRLIGDENFKGLIDEFAKNTLTSLNKTNLEAAERLIVFAGSLSAIAKSCAELSGNEGDSINNLIKIVDSISFDSVNVSDLSVKFGELGNALGNFALQTSNLTTENMSNAERALTMLLRLAEGLNRIRGDSIFSTLFLGKREDLQSFGTGIEALGTHLAAFFESLQNYRKGGLDISHTYNVDNLNMAMTALEVIARTASDVDYIDTKKIEAFSNHDTMRNLASGLGHFLTSIFDTSIVPEMTDDKIKYVEDLVKAIEQIFNCLAKLKNIDVSNYDFISDDQKGLGAYLDKVLIRIIEFASNLNNKQGMAQSLKTIDDNYTTLLHFSTLVSQYASVLEKLNTTVKNPDYSSKSFTEIMDALFGYSEEQKHLEAYTTHANWEEKDVTTYFHGGMLSTMVDFVNDLSNSMNFTDEGLDAFDKIANMVIAYSNAISGISEAVEFSIGKGYLFDFNSFVTNMANALDVIVNRKDTFTNFFNTAKDFDRAGLQSSFTLMSMLNQLAQTIRYFDDVNPENAITRFEVFDWKKLFEILTNSIGTFELSPKVIISDDFVTSIEQMWKSLGTSLDTDGKVKEMEFRIAPVLEAPSDDFRKNAEEFKSILNFGSGTMSPDFSIRINTDGLDDFKPKNYETQINEIRDMVREIKTTASQFSDDLSNFRFFIDGDELTNKIGGHISQYLTDQDMSYIRGSTNG